jgi:hypothetical protein
MYNTFVESYKSKLRFNMTDERVVLKYPEVSGNNYKFTAVLGAQGLGLKCPKYYHQGIGKFNVTI